MKKLLICIAIALFSFTGYSQEETTTVKTTYYLIRHAEKDRSNEDNKNPDLIEKGQQRAKKWATLLSNFNIQEVYSTDYNRTRQTAKPTADAFGLTIKTYHPFKLDFEKFLKDTKGKSVLVVGHSNTIPFFVNKLINKKEYQQIEDNNNTNLYIVTIKGNEVANVLIKTKD